MNQLESIGWGPDWVTHFEEIVQNHKGPDLVPARLTEEHRGAFAFAAECGAARAVTAGRLRYDGHAPGVGDWVAIHIGETPPAVIHHILPRRTALVRKTPGEPGGQLLASNVDIALIVTSANRDYNLRRVERLVAIVVDGGALPVIVLNKCDLVDDPEPILDELRGVARGFDVLPVSATEGQGLAAVRALASAGKTLTLLGSSGVGKSTLSNALAGEEVLPTGAIRDSDDRGRHTTTYRQLIPLPGGAALIDTPGVRLAGVWMEEDHVAVSFSDIDDLAATCRFGNCAHGAEPGCAVQAAIADGDLDPARLESYEKLQREARRHDVPKHEFNAKQRKLTRSYKKRPPRWER